MEAPEVPTEHLQEHLQHQAEHAHGENWIMGVALSSAIIAGLAAIASLLAGADANLAMIGQMQASDQWNYYQAKGVKANVLASKIELLVALGKAPDSKDQAKIAEYKSEQERIQAEAKEKEAGSREHLENHERLARAVTIFQISIALGAVSALARRRAFWYVSLVAAVVGAIFLTSAMTAHIRLVSRERLEPPAVESHSAEAPH